MSRQPPPNSTLPSMATPPLPHRAAHPSAAAGPTRLHANMCRLPHLCCDIQYSTAQYHSWATWETGRNGLLLLHDDCTIDFFFPASAGQMIVSRHGAAAAHVARWRVRSGWLARRGGRRSSTAVTKLLEDDDQSPSERIREEAREGGDAAVGRRRGHLLYHEICSHSSILGHGMMGKRPGRTGSLSLMAHCSTFDDTAC
jgi:hypothetical protein